MNFDDLEQARAKYAKKLKVVLMVGLAIFAATILINLSVNVWSSANLNSHHDFSLFSGIFFTLFPGAFIATFTSIIVLIVTYKDGKEYKRLYKAYFVEQSLRQTFTHLRYHHNLGLPKSVLASTGMIDTGDIYASNDLVYGKYKDVAFSQADVEIQKTYTDSDGDTHRSTIFKGRWLVFEFPKPFTFRLQVVEKWFGPNMKPRKDNLAKRKIERIRTESTEFNKKFKVYAEDGFEAYYILDPAFISHIEDLDNSRKGKLMLCFVDNKLHVAIYDNKDAFEPPSPFKAIDERAEFAKIHQDIQAITDYVDFLKLDHKLFSKN